MDGVVVREVISLEVVNSAGVSVTRKKNSVNLVTLVLLLVKL